jgi:hypothetical protein
VPGRHQAGTEKGMEILDPAIRAAPRRAVRAMDLARAEVLAAVERDEHASAQTLERPQRGGGESRQAAPEQPVESRRRHPVEHQPDVIVARNGRDPKQRLAIRAAVPRRQRPLIGQEGGAAHKEQRERRQADIRHRIGARLAWPLAPVRQIGADLPQIRDQALQHTHAALGSWATPRRNAQPLAGAHSPRIPPTGDKLDLSRPAGSRTLEHPSPLWNATRPH